MTMAPSLIRFGDCELDLAAYEVRRGGQRCAVEPQVFELLAYLVRNPSRLVTKDELIAEVWGGRIVSDAALSGQIKAARQTIGDDGEQQRFIRTVHGRGFRFVGEIEPAVQPSGTELLSGPEERPLALPDKPSIAVLAFANLSGDPEQEYFADGIVEDIITALSRIRWLFVIARNSSFTYKGKAVDVKQVGREMGVRYVLEGSVRKTGGRVRITGQLIDAGSGVHLWADRYDGVLDDVFDLQDRVTESVVAAVGPRIRSEELQRVRRKRPESLVAYDYYLQALPHFYAVDAAANAEALRLLSLAQHSDPTYAAAHAMAAFCRIQRRQQGWGSGASDTIAALAVAEQALACDPEDPLVLWTAGHAVAVFGKQYDRGRGLIDRSLVLNPNSADAWCISGWHYIFAGEPLRGLTDLDRARRLSPFDPLTFYVYTAICAAYLNLREFDQAIHWGRKALQERPGFAAPLRQLAAAFAYSGRMAEAKEMIRDLLEVEPGLTVTIVDESRCNVHHATIRKHFLDGLRLAGLPE
jgi:TolB-like protein